MKRQSRKGFTLIELLVVVAIIALLIAILIPSLGRAKELANRSACGASLTGIVKALNLYSAENTDQFPVVQQKTDKTYVAPSTALTTGVSSSSTNTSVVIQGYFNQAAAGAFASGDPMASLWILVLKGNLSPKQFICKSDPSSPSISDQTDTTGNYYYTFGTIGSTASQNCVSYSVAYPWSGSATVGAFWKATVDSSLPLMSDMAPLNATGNPAKATAKTKGDPTITPKTINSNNHSGGDGQNVVFADTHVEFQASPFCGQGGDNIWCTGSTGSTQTAVTAGTLTADPTNSPPYDMVFVPVRDASTNLQK